ncbi:MAG: nitrate ABC transporter ATP-binding protein, partial [Candidimonas sp.]
MTAPMEALHVTGVNVTYPSLKHGGSVVALKDVN